MRGSKAYLVSSSRTPAVTVAQRCPPQAPGAGPSDGVGVGADAISADVYGARVG